MADPQYFGGGRQNRRGRRAAASETHDWEPRRGESRHSLPHRTRQQPEVQRPDRRKQKYSSHRSRPSEDLPEAPPMPPMRLLTRASTPKSRGRRAYDEDDDEDDDDDSEKEKERLRGRLRSRSRPAWESKSRATSKATSKMASRGPSRVALRAKSRGANKSRPTSRDSRSTDSSTVPTPTRSSFVNIRSAPSAPSLGALSGSSSDDSDDDSSDSTRDYRRNTRTLKERMNGTPDSEPMPNPISRSRSRHKSRDRIIPEIESPSEDSDDQVPSRPRIIVKRRSLSRRRQAQQSRSPSRAPRPQRRSNRHSGGHATSLSPKRAPKKFYDSDGSYSREPTFSRSRPTSASRVKSARSAASSSKPSLGPFFPTSGPPQLYNKKSKGRACTVCGEGVSTKKAAKLKCGHLWCRSCLKRNFKVSIEDPQSTPPRCCTSIIPLEHVNDLFDDSFKRTWNEKFGKSPAGDRIYCPKTKCREWIRPADYRHHSNGRTSATCRNCDTKICGACHKKWHESKHCPTDADTAQFLQVAKDAGWKRCYKCKAMVELKEGCNHMTCLCGAQFCMTCGGKWKSCDCPRGFTYQLQEDDFGNVPITVPMVSRERLGGTDGLPRGLRPDLAYAHEPPRRHHGRPAEDRARRMHHLDPEYDDDDEDDDDDDDDEDYLGEMDNGMGMGMNMGMNMGMGMGTGMSTGMGTGMGMGMGMGNTTNHFMSNGYRARSHSTIVPPVAVPSAPSAPTIAHERPTAGGNYVSGLNKARGMRGSSMERRLADRFSEQRQGFATPPPPRPFGQPPTAPPLGMGALPHQPPLVPSPISRRHTIDNDMYDSPFDPRYGAHAIPRRAPTHGYMDDFAVHPSLGRQRYRQMEPPKPSELAGLTGPGSGMNRVFEWRNHVETYPPDNQTVA